MRHLVVVLGCLLLLAGSPAVAQETTGEIQGAVASQDGQPLSGVKVTIENPDVGFSRSAVTRDQGEFRFSALAPARYQLTAVLDGFQTLRRPVEVHHGRTSTADVSLEIGIGARRNFLNFLC